MKTNQGSYLKDILKIKGYVDNYRRENEEPYNFNNNDKHFDSNLFNQGMEWFRNGLTLEDAPDSFKNDASFIKGYNRGQRLAIIQELNSNSRSR